MGDELEEWKALIEEALRIREPSADKERRLAQLRRDIVRAELTGEQVGELMARIQQGLEDGSR